jgi:hypothetical protein
MYGTAAVLPKRLNFIPHLLGIYALPGFILGKLGEEERDCGINSTCGKVKKYIQVSNRKI